MPQKAYALERGGEKRLKVSWGPYWRDTTFELDGKTICVVPGQDELINGETIKLLDGSTLEVVLSSPYDDPEQLHLVINGKPLPGTTLPGSGPNPLRTIRGISSLLITYGVFHVFWGLNMIDFRMEKILSSGLSTIIIIIGTAYIVSGLLVRRRSIAALIFIMICFVFEVAYVILSGSVTIRSVYEILATVFSILYILHIMGEGIKAIKKLRAESEESTIEWE